MIVCAFLLSCLDAGPEVDVQICLCLSRVCCVSVCCVFLVSVSVCLSRCDCILCTAVQAYKLQLHAWNTEYRTARILYNCVIVYRVSCILYLVSTILYTTTLPLTRNHVTSKTYPPCHWKQDAGTRHDHRWRDNITENDRQSRHHVSCILYHASGGSSYDVHVP